MAEKWWSVGLDTSQLAKDIEYGKSKIAEFNKDTNEKLKTSNALKDFKESSKQSIGYIEEIKKQLFSLEKRRPKIIDIDELSRANKRIEILKADLQAANNIGKSGFDEFGYKIKTVNQELDNSSSKSTSFIGRLKGIATAVGIAFGVDQIINWGKELFSVANLASGIDRAFTRIGGTKYLEKLRGETEGFVSDLNLERLTNQAKNLNVPIEHMGVYLSFAAQRAKDTGESVDKLTNDIINGLGRESPRVIDNLGISQKELNREIQKTGNFAQAVSNIMQRQMGIAGASVDTLADKTNRLSVIWENFKKKIATGFTSVLFPSLADDKLIGDRTEKMMARYSKFAQSTAETRQAYLETAQKALDSSNKELEFQKQRRASLDVQAKQRFISYNEYDSADKALKAASEQAVSARNVVNNLREQNRLLEKQEDIKKGIVSINDLNEKKERLLTQLNGSLNATEQRKLRNEIKATQDQIDKINGSYDKKHRQKDTSKQLSRNYEIEARQEIETKRAAEDLQNQIEQATIDAMNEGSEKRLKQMDLNHKKELSALVRQREDLLTKRRSDARGLFESDPKNDGKVFNVNNVKLTGREEGLFESLNQATQGKQLLETGAFYKELYAKYQDYTTQRVEIEKKFNKDIETLQSRRKETTNANEQQIIDKSIAEATKKKGESLMDFDFEQLKKTPEYVRAFENLRQTSGETLDSLLTQLEQAKQTAAKTLDPAALKAYTSSIQGIMDELERRNPFKVLNDRKSELAKAEEELAKATTLMNEAKSGDDNGGTFDDEGKFISTAQAADKYRIALDKVTQKKAQVVSSQKAVDDIFQKLASSISNVGQSIGGLSGDIIGMTGSIVSTVSATATGLDSIDKTMSATMKTIEKSSIILAAISAAYQIGTKIASLFTGQDKKQYESMKQNYENLIKVWDTLIDRKLEYLNASTGKDVVQSEKELLEILKKQEEATRQLALERLRVKNGGHSIDYRMWQGSYSFNGQTWDDVATEISRSIGKSINSMSDFTKLSADDLRYIQENYAGLWSHMDDDFRSFLEQVIQYGDKAKDVSESAQAALTTVSFDDFKNSYLDMLSDLDSSNQDFSENLEKYLQKAMFSNLLDQKYKERIQDLYKMFSTANEDGDINSTEAKNLRDAQEALAADMLKERENLKNTFGWTSSANGVTGELQQAMTEGSASQLIGLQNMMAMDIRAIKEMAIKKLMTNSDGTPIINVNFDYQGLFDESRLIQANTFRTANNTDGLVPAINQLEIRLAAIEKNTKPNNSRL